MLKVSLPSSLGRLNIRSTPLHVPAAYVSSLVQSTPLIVWILGIVHDSFQCLASSVCALAEAVERPNCGSLEDIDIPLQQHPLSHSEASFHHLLNSAPDSLDRVLVFSSAIPHAGDWLDVVPCSDLGLHFHDQEYRLCLDYWLGLRMSEKDSLGTIF